MTARLEQRKAPAVWASYLLNGDASGIDQDDKDAADRYFAGYDVLDCADEASFSWSYDLHGGLYEGGDLLEYTVRRDPSRTATPI